MQFFTVVISFISLVYSFVISDFSNATVYNNSHSTKPLFYKITGTWGNHEGSLLMWILILTIFNFLFVIYDSSNFKLRNKIIANQSFLILGFLAFCLFMSSPFTLMEESFCFGLLQNCHLLIWNECDLFDSSSLNIHQDEYQQI